jgi:pyruvate dehydrogenase E1 component alpha subunit
MLRIRRFEEKAGQLYGMGLIEVSAICISGRKRSSLACRWPSKGDKVITGYRDHGHMLACGMDPKA